MRVEYSGPFIDPVVEASEKERRERIARESEALREEKAQSIKARFDTAREQRERNERAYNERLQKIAATMPAFPELEKLKGKIQAKNDRVSDVDAKIDAVRKQIHAHQAAVKQAKEAGDADEIIRLGSASVPGDDIMKALGDVREQKAGEDPFTVSELMEAWEGSKKPLLSDMDKAEKKLVAALEAYKEALRAMEYQEERFWYAHNQFARLKDNVQFEYPHQHNHAAKHMYNHGDHRIK